MTADDIRKSKLSETDALREIAAQLAELNQIIRERSIEIRLVGAGATDLHTITVALAEITRRGLLP